MSDLETLPVTSSREVWLAERRKGIGGSDVAALLGLSPWCSPIEVFLDKRGEIAAQPENEAMRWGNILEPVVRQEYSNRTGFEVLMPTGMLQHPKHSFMLANLDGFTPEGRLFEAKTARSPEGWGEAGSDEVPQGYLFQVQHYMAVTGYALTDIAVLIGGSDFRIYTVEADADLQSMMIDAEAEFWRRVIENEPPEPLTIEQAQALWGRSSASRAVVADEHLIAAVERLRETRAAIEYLRSQEDAEKLTIMSALQDADTLTGADGKPLVTWKASKPVRRVDSKLLRAKHPDIFTEVAPEGAPSRPFLLK